MKKKEPDGGQAKQTQGYNHIIAQEGDSMQYVGHEGVVAAWYAVATGCLPEIAFYKAFGQNVPMKLRGELIMELDEIDIEDKHYLVGLTKRQSYHEYRCKAAKEAKK